MDNHHISQDIKERLVGFPEESIPELIDYIELLKQNHKAKIEKSIKPLKQEYFSEAGP